VRTIARIWQNLRGNEPFAPGGHLVLVVGPSGAGKDTLIACVQSACRGDPGVVFPRRTVTRPASQYEDHDTLSESDFTQALNSGSFSLHWEAHGLRYGIPVEIEQDLNGGKTVVCNISRTVIGEARRKCSRTSVVLVTAPADVLAGRLAARERPTDGRQSERLSRSVASAADFRPDLIIENTGKPEEGARELLKLVHRHRGARDFVAGQPVRL
jgi:ribose 1,5-bisphosphokinase